MGTDKHDAAAAPPKLDCFDNLRNELNVRLTDGFLEALLRGLQASFMLNEEYRRNIEGFNAVFVFRSKDGVGATAVFHDGTLDVESEPRPVFDTRISFRNAEGLRNSLMAGNDNLLDTMLSDPIDAEGNLSNLYRFGFLANELTTQLGIT